MAGERARDLIGDQAPATGQGTRRVLAEFQLLRRIMGQSLRSKTLREDEPTATSVVRPRMSRLPLCGRQLLHVFLHI